ncbi:MAG: 3-ketoacyl-ACP reductase [Spirochaetales bacterium]
MNPQRATHASKRDSRGSDRESVRTALVTGGSRGIGRAISVELASLGISVAVNYNRNREAADETVAACLNAGAPRAVAIGGNVGDPGAGAALVEASVAELGEIDVLVNNAGRAPRAREDILSATRESFEEVLAVNLTGPYFLTQTLARRWLDTGSPKSRPRAVVFISSLSAETVSLNRGEYCVSKAGLAMATKLWAARLAEAGIPVVEIRPGITETDMTAGVKEKYDALIAEGLVPQRRWGQPEDVARLVAAVVRGDFAYSTGAVVDCDGGFHISRL